MHKQVILLILDGFGSREAHDHNAIAKANTPFWDSIYHQNHSLLSASGLAVGLPHGQIGSSEVGHMTIGCGRPIDTDLVSISKAIDTGEFFQKEKLVELSNFVKKHNSTMHLFGMVSPGGVHSHSNHLHSTLKLCAEQGVKKVAIHVITDGRDTSPQSAAGYIEELEEMIAETGIGSIATMTGRYYAMDRDNNWERTHKAASAMFDCTGDTSSQTKPSEKIRELYAQGKSDEFFEPVVFLENEKGTGFELHDGAIFFNFRADRARQLSSLIQKKAEEKQGMFITFTEYESGQTPASVFQPTETTVTLASVVSDEGLTQAHIAETEKYAHVTYFLNGGVETEHAGERFIMIESRKDVATHDLAPEMKASEITENIVKEINLGTNLIIANYANADMVGHSGNHEATILAVECLDKELKKVCAAAATKNTPVFITADHGNAELNFDEATGKQHTAHTTNLVPAVLVGEDTPLRDGGELADVAPTILQLLGLSKPDVMTGTSLISK